MVTQETLNYLFDDRPHGLKPSLTHWLNASPRFADFVATHRDKIRKKIKGIHEADGFLDLRAELETAYRLLQEKRFDLAYEPYSQGTGRGPDFAVTFRTRITFNVEVTRMRLTKGEGNEGPLPFNPPYESRRMAEIVSSKLRQMLPSMMNLLVVVADDQVMCELDVGRVMNRLKQRAEQKEPQLFQRHRFRDPADFFKYYYRLSGVWLRSSGQPETGPCPILWLNNQTKHPLPAPICTILQR
ncbi:MAG: hypothetical protein H6631_02325 [Anaerolineaceae bacterium]|nr:hypothetical protein [Anaerolineaceae bacterium]MCB9099933.1 hypothetical protein [Anaerolineales bacterium]